jgi:O-antigen/teichoic acid export membrane protein
MQITEEKEALQPANSRVVARNAVWGILGRAGPMLVALLLTPMLIHQMGPSRWGVFTIALSITGMMGVFDFGIGRALTRSVALSIGSGDGDQAAPGVMAGIAALTVFGAIGGLLLAAGLDRWTHGALQVPQQLQTEVRVSLYILCLAVPLMLLNAALFGVLSAYQRQRQLSLLNIPIMVMYYVGPLVSFYFWHNLIGVIAILVVLRAIMTYQFWRLCLQCMPSLRSAKPSWAELKPLLRMSSWMTVSNLTWPILSYIDRFVVASFVSAAATGYYSTPADLTARVYLVPIAVSNSAFPAMAGSYSADPQNASNILRRSILSISTALFPVALILVAFSDQVLRLWLGPAFAVHSAPVLRWFGTGILIACTDCIAANVLDAIGMPRINALFSIMELVLYVPLLALLVKTYGIEGAAMAWVARMLLDFLVRLFLVSRFYPAGASAAAKGAFAVLVGSALLWFPGLFPTMPAKVMGLAMCLTAYGVAVWFGSMTLYERSLAREKFARLARQVQPS